MPHLGLNISGKQSTGSWNEIVVYEALAAENTTLLQGLISANDLLRMEAVHANREIANGATVAIDDSIHDKGDLRGWTTVELEFQQVADRCSELHSGHDLSLIHSRLRFRVFSFPLRPCLFLFFFATCFLAHSPLWRSRVGQPVSEQHSPICDVP